jgi:hypothetical protein
MTDSSLVMVGLPRMTHGVFYSERWFKALYSGTGIERSKAKARQHTGDDAFARFRGPDRHPKEYSVANGGGLK